MQLINFESSSVAPPFTDRYVAGVQDEIGITFPAEYIELMRKANGGKPRQCYFLLDKNEKVVERFLSFVEDYKSSPFGMYDIEVVWSQIEDRLEEGVCPFAALFAGDFLCFDGRGELPTVVVWNYDKAARGEPALTQVAGSFVEFLTMLKD